MPRNARRKWCSSYLPYVRYIRCTRIGRRVRSFSLPRRVLSATVCVVLFLSLISRVCLLASSFTFAVVGALSRPALHGKSRLREISFVSPLLPLHRRHHLLLLLLLLLSHCCVVVVRCGVSLSLSYTRRFIIRKTLYRRPDVQRSHLKTNPNVFLHLLYFLLHL